MEGKGEYTIRDLVRNALRMRPDRIVVGECRGGECLDMLQAMNTGHDGSLTTTHANSPREAINRLEVLALMSGLDLPARAIREQIANSVHLVVQQSRFSDGSRRVTAITEVIGLDDNFEVQLRPIFEFVRSGTGPGGKVLGEYRATGYLPSFLDLFISLRARAREGLPMNPSPQTTLLGWLGVLMFAGGVAVALYITLTDPESPLARKLYHDYAKHLDGELKALFIQEPTGRYIANWQIGLLAVAVVVTAHRVVLEVPVTAHRLGRAHRASWRPSSGSSTQKNKRQEKIEQQLDTFLTRARQRAQGLALPRRRARPAPRSCARPSSEELELTMKENQLGDAARPGHPQHGRARGVAGLRRRAHHRAHRPADRRRPPEDPRDRRRHAARDGPPRGRRAHQDRRGQGAGVGARHRCRRSSWRSSTGWTPSGSAPQHHLHRRDHLTIAVAFWVAGVFAARKILAVDI
jgi:hypothetical protein